MDGPSYIDVARDSKAKNAKLLKDKECAAFVRL